MSNQDQEMEIIKMKIKAVKKEHMEFYTASMFHNKLAVSEITTKYQHLPLSGQGLRTLHAPWSQTENSKASHSFITICCTKKS